MYKIVATSLVTALVLGSSFAFAAETKSVDPAKKDPVVTETMPVRDGTIRMKSDASAKIDTKAEKTASKSADPANMDSKAKSSAEPAKDKTLENAKPAHIKGEVSAKPEGKVKHSISDAAVEKADKAKVKAEVVNVKADKAATKADAPNAKAEPAKQEALKPAADAKVEAKAAAMPVAKAETAKPEIGKTDAAKAETAKLDAAPTKTETAKPAPKVN